MGVFEIKGGKVLGMEEYKRICPNCYKEVSSRDMYLDLESGKIGCTYCFEDKIRQHSDWCKEWRKKNMAKEKSNK